MDDDKTHLMSVTSLYCHIRVQSQVYWKFTGNEYFWPHQEIFCIILIKEYISVPIIMTICFSSLLFKSLRSVRFDIYIFFLKIVILLLSKDACYWSKLNIFLLLQNIIFSLNNPGKKIIRVSKILSSTTVININNSMIFFKHHWNDF